MRTIVAAMCVVLALGCKRREDERKPPSAGAMPGIQQPAVGSAAFHLEMGAVYARFQDARTAAEHLSKAVTLASDPVQRAQAYSALARVKEAGGDPDDAIAALERARTELEASRANVAPGGAPGGMPLAGPGADDVAIRLARLYAQRARDPDALRACERGLSQAQQPWQREQLLRLEVDLLRKAGTLDERIAEGAKALEGAAPAESALWFLVVALGGDALSGPAPGGAPAGRPQAVSSTLVRACERLHELHPEDSQLRRVLLSLLERVGRTDDAVKLVEAGPTGGATSCAGVFGPQAMPAALEGPVEVARIRARAGQKEKALAEAGKIAALAGREGISAYLVAADLYTEQGDRARAAEMVRRAASEARSNEDRRRVALARERAARMSGEPGGAEPLWGEWERSPDPCLRQAAAQRKARPAMMAAGQLPVPPPAAPP